MPPEWEPQQAIWLSWPTNKEHWNGKADSTLQEKFAEIAATISRFQNVFINASKEHHSQISGFLNDAKTDLTQVQIFDHPNNDVWCRDHGPIFVKHSKTHELAITNWEFNGWGGKFTPYDLDNTIPEKIGACLQLPIITTGMVLEGGSIEVNGQGQLLTTEAVLLNKNRNPKLCKEEIEEKLKQHLGIDEILWLKEGIEGDDTDGHIDDLARFTANDTIVAATDSKSPNRKILEMNLERLKGFHTKDGKPFTIHELPLPDPCEASNWRLPILPASYVNFLIINGAVLVPTFRQKTKDQLALEMIQSLFPSREIIGIDCLDLVAEGGSLHCISQQQPAS